MQSLGALSANFDWTLIVRCEITDAQEQMQIQRRLANMHWRMRWHHRVCSLLAQFIRHVPSTASSATTSDAGTVTGASARVEIMDLFLSPQAEYVQLTQQDGSYDAHDQRICTGGNEQFDTTMFSACGNVFIFAHTLMATLAQLQSNGAVVVDVGPLAVSVSNVAASISDLSQYLVRQTQTSKYMTSAHPAGHDGSHLNLVHPEFIQRVSFYVRSVGSWSTLLLQAVCKHFTSFERSNAAVFLDTPKAVFVKAIQDVADAFTRLAGMCTVLLETICR
jgi:hypothetical protein